MGTAPRHPLYNGKSRFTNPRRIHAGSVGPPTRLPPIHSTRLDFSFHALVLELGSSTVSRLRGAPSQSFSISDGDVSIQSDAKRTKPRYAGHDTATMTTA